MMEESDCLISVITVVKNDDVGLRRTAASLTVQTINKEIIEWIIIEGGQQPAVEDSFFLTSPAIKLISVYGADRGIFDAMNKAVDLCSGRYLLYLNAGDSLADGNVLRDVSTFLVSSSACIVAGFVSLTWRTLGVPRCDLYPWVPHQAAFLRRDLINQYRFDSSLKFYGDLDLWSRMRRDGTFEVFRIERKITDFEMGGAGNSPAYFWVRLRERTKIGRRYKEPIMRTTGRILYSVLVYTIYVIFGESAYYKLVMKKK